MKNHEIQLGQVVFDLEAGELRDARGEGVALRHQAKEVLEVLATHPNDLVSKDDLMEAVWQSRSGSEEGLIQCIAEIRRALNDTDKSIVETIPRKGYRLAVTPSRTIGNPIRRWAALTVLLAFLTVAGTFIWSQKNQAGSDTSPVIAVLPFDDLTPEDAEFDLGDAVSDSTIASLARYPEFSIISGQSSSRFRGVDLNVREISEALGADYLVQGSQRLNEGQLWLSVRLVSADDGRIQWTDVFDLPLEDLFDVNDQIAFRIANEISTTVVSVVATQERSDGEVDALILDMRARHIMRSGASRESWLAALDLHDQTIREFPDAALGYIGRALMLRVGVRFGWQDGATEETLAEAERLARHGIELWPEHYLAHYALGRVLMQRGDIPRSIAALERAMNLNPSSVNVLNALAQSYLYADELEAMQVILDRTSAIDPIPGLVSIWVRAWGQWQAGDCDLALETMHTIPATPPDARKLLAVIHICLGDSSSARALIDTYMERFPDWTLDRELETNAENWIADGPRDRWLAALAEAGIPAGPSQD